MKRLMRKGSRGRARRIAVVFALALGSAAAGCGSRQSPTPLELSQRANQRLQGTWTLRGFQPESPLEPMLQGLLNAQFGSLQVHFDGTTMLVSGAGVSVQRRYEIISAAGDALTLAIYDEPGIAYRVYGEFRANELHFKSLDTPWRGQGVLLRG